MPKNSSVGQILNPEQDGSDAETRVANALQGNAVESSAATPTGSGSQSTSATEMYDAIRASNTDVTSISENTGFKKKNVEKVKDHVFNQEHLLDRYVEQRVLAETKRFDCNKAQAEAWIRLESGTHTPADITWMKHETAESWYEKKHDSGYSEAHDRVEGRWSGYPWTRD